MSVLVFHSSGSWSFWQHKCSGSSSGFVEEGGILALLLGSLWLLVSTKSCSLSHELISWLNISESKVLPFGFFLHHHKLQTRPHPLIHLGPHEQNSWRLEVKTHCWQRILALDSETANMFIWHIHYSPFRQKKNHLLISSGIYQTLEVQLSAKHLPLNTILQIRSFHTFWFVFSILRPELSLDCLQSPHIQSVFNPDELRHHPQNRASIHKESSDCSIIQCIYS